MKPPLLSNPPALLTRKGEPVSCLENVHRLLDDGEQVYWYFQLDLMGSVTKVNGKQIDNPKLTEITRWINDHNVLCSSSLVSEVISEMAARDTLHPVRDYLNELVWDGKERLSTWLGDFLGVEDAPHTKAYTRAVARAWLISAVARAYNPGCKADCMLVLEGPQGVKKSTAMRALCHDDRWFLEDMRDIHGKDCLMQFGGKWIVEVAELQSFKGADNGRLKAFISTRSDSYRPPYARLTINIPRSVLFVGTSNETSYIKDPTGGRRFWPVTCGEIDVEGIVENRDQLWAEAAAAYRAGEKWWLIDDDALKEAQEQQEHRFEADPWEEIVEEYLEFKDTVTVNQIFNHLETPTSGLYTTARAKIARTKVEQMRLTDILKRLGWEKKQIGSDRTRSWAREPPPKPKSGEVDLGVVLGENRGNPQGEPREPREPPITPAYTDLSLRSVGTFGPVGRARGIDFVAFFAPKVRFGRPNL